VNPNPKPALRYAEGQWSAAVPVPTVVSDTWPKAADVETAPDAALIPLPPQLDPALNKKKSQKKSKKKQRDSDKKRKAKKKDGKASPTKSGKKKEGKKRKK